MDNAQMSLFSMKLEKTELISAAIPHPDHFPDPSCVPVTLLDSSPWQAFILNPDMKPVVTGIQAGWFRQRDG